MNQNLQIEPELSQQVQPKRARGTGRIFAREGTTSLWIQYSRDGHRYRESANTDDPKKAEKLLQKRLGEIANDEFLPPKSRRVKISELAEDFLLDYDIQNHASKDDAKARWELHLKPFFGHRRAKDVTTEMLKRYVANRQEAGAKNATINRELAALKRMFNLARQSSPPKVLRVPAFPTKLAEDNVRRGFVEDAQYDTLAAACAKRGLWLRAMLEIGYSFGCRVGELLNLRVRQVDLAARTVRLEETKNGEDRIFTLTAKAYALVQQCITGKKPDDHLFTRTNGKPVGDFRGTWSSVCCAVGLGRMLCKECETPVEHGKCSNVKCSRHSLKRKLKLKEQIYEGLIFHDLRRTAVRNMVRAGVPERVAMTISGHKTRSVFDRYNIVSERDLQEAARKLEQRLVMLQPEGQTKLQTDEHSQNRYN